MHGHVLSRAPRARFLAEIDFSVIADEFGRLSWRQESKDFDYFVSPEYRSMIQFKGHRFGLNGSGTLIWLSLAVPKTTDELIDSQRTFFEFAESNTVQMATLQFLLELRERELVVVHADHAQIADET